MRIEERKSDWKKGIDATEGRRRRNETSIKLRKDKKVEGLAKRRAMVALNPTDGFSANATALSSVDSSQSKKSYTVSDIPSLLGMLSQRETVLEGVRGFRKILSVEFNPPVQEVLNCGVLSILVQLLGLNDQPTVQFEAAWAITNIASTEHTRVVVDAGAVPYFVALLSSPSEEVREQSAWCLGNVAGDCPELRDIVLMAGGLEPLLNNIRSPANASLLGNCVWALSNFCRGKPQPLLSHVEAAAPFLSSIVRGNNNEAKVDALWALSYMSDGDNDRIQKVIDSGVVDTLVELLNDAPDGMGILTPALRTVGNIVSGNDEQTQAALDAGLIGKISKLLHHPKKMVKKESLWVISNIAAGTQQQIDKVMSKDCDMQRVVALALKAEWEVRKEAIWCISNVATGGTDDHVVSIVECDAIDALCSILNINDAKMLLVAMDAIESILKVGRKLGKDYPSFVDECDGLLMLEELQHHDSNDVYEKAVSIIESYFGLEEEGDDENLAPEINGDTFGFGLPQKNLGTSLEADGPENDYHQPVASFNFVNFNN